MKAIVSFSGYRTEPMRIEIASRILIAMIEQGKQNVMLEVAG